MSFGNSLVKVFCFSMVFVLSGYSQNKFEKEYRIKSSEVPKPILDFINQAPFDKKIKWYAEESQDGKSIEAKTCYKNKKYSIEFDINGNLQDIEQKITFTSIPITLRTKIQKSLDSIFTKSKVKKAQKQWIGSRSAIISLINKKSTAENYSTNYELTLRGKKDKLYTDYELLYDDKGILLKILKIVNTNTDNLIF